MLSPDTIHIVSCTDKNYLQHLGVLITSLFENKTCENNLVYHIFHTDLEEADQQLLKESVRKYKTILEFHNVGTFHSYDSIIRYGHVSKSALYRLSIGDILPVTIEKVLYLDCDIIVNGDLLELWNTRLENHQVAAVEDAPIFTRHEQLLMPKESRYFNSGVLLINLVKWRSNNTSLKVIDFLIKYPERRLYNDQDGLNSVLHSDWLRLPPVFNQQTALFYLPQKRLVYTRDEYLLARKHPVIIHYTGVVINTKPWHYIDSHPFKYLYYRYLRLTPWSGFQATSRGIKDVIRKYYLIAVRIKMKSGIVFSNIFK
jgi:lipopolysaccharide biosynthesis glycosyltransferase